MNIINYIVKQLNIFLLSLSCLNTVHLVMTQSSFGLIILFTLSVTYFFLCDGIMLFVTNIEEQPEVMPIEKAYSYKSVV